MYTEKDMKGMQQIRRALQMFAGTLPETQAREVAAVYPVWKPGVRYEEDAYLIHGNDENEDPLLYRVVQAHISSSAWPPADAPALYVCLSLDEEGWPIWSPPTGAQDAYNAGDIVSYMGTLYRSKIDGNTTEPSPDDRWWEIYEEA